MLDKPIFIENYQSPGDILMLTAAIRDLKTAYPSIRVNVKTSAQDIWDHNPYLDKTIQYEDNDILKIRAEYPLIHKSDKLPYHFIHGFRKFLADKLSLRIPQGPFRGDIHLSDQEKRWMSQIEEMDIKDKFWIVMAGGKYDFTAKWWDPANYQKVVDHFKNKLLFVQCGEAHHFHPKLNNVIDLIGKTNTRQFIRLVYHSSGILCPVTFAMHLASAVPTKKNLYNRPCVVIAGSREPSHWEAYPHHRYLHNIGSLSCCESGGCWKSRCTKVGDNDLKDSEGALCVHPIQTSTNITLPNKTQQEPLFIAKCMNMITVNNVIEAIESYYVQ